MINPKYAGTCLYRGKELLYNGEFIEGQLLEIDGKNYIIDVCEQIKGNEDLLYYKDKIAFRLFNGNEINHKTLSIWTGLNDKNGIKIFSGDIVTLKGKRYRVCWNKHTASFVTKNGADQNNMLNYPKCYEIVDNVWDALQDAVNSPKEKTK